MKNPAFLQSYSLFGGINDLQMNEIIPHLKEENFSEGEAIICEGDLGDKIYFICEGSVEVVKTACTPSGETEENQLAILRKGDTFGEMELIDIQSRTATVRTLEKTSVLTMSNKDMYELYHQDIKVFTIIIMNLAREISRRLRKMDAIVATSMCAQHHA